MLHIRNNEMHTCLPLVGNGVVIHLCCGLVASTCCKDNRPAIVQWAMEECACSMLSFIAHWRARAEWVVSWIHDDHISTEGWTIGCTQDHDLAIMQGHTAVSRSSLWQVGPTLNSPIGIDIFCGGQPTTAIKTPSNKESIIHHSACMPGSFVFHGGNQFPGVCIPVKSVAGICSLSLSLSCVTPTNYGGAINNTTCSTTHGKWIGWQIGTGSWWWADINHLAFVSSWRPSCHHNQRSWNNKTAILILILSFITNLLSVLG